MAMKFDAPLGRGRRAPWAPAAAPLPLALGVLAALAFGTAFAQEPGAPSGRQPGTLPEPLVYLRDIDASILQDMRYAGSDNFTGRRVPGYGAGECVLLREVAEALSRVQQTLLERKLSLKVYDCYRPRRAVRAFVASVQDAEAGADPLLKRFHPNIERSLLIKLGYVAAVSRHSLGDTVDLTLVRLPAKQAPPFSRTTLYGACTGPAEDRAPDTSVDMGTGFDCFDPRSHTDAPEITAEQQRWRRTLVETMAREGFRNYPKEWWHFTLARAHSVRVFDVPILPRRP